MKLSLVVKAAGKQEGKVLPITLSQFVIGRDPQCQLRPASAMISKRHCALVQRDGKAFIRDFGSTNGSFVNDQPVQEEAELHDKDRLKIGPLAFEVRIIQDGPAAKGATPKPPTKPVAAPAAKTPLPPSKAPAASAKGDGADDDIAAMLLSLHDDDAAASGGADGQVPEGSTVMELMLPKGMDDSNKPVEKEKEKPKAPANTANAAKSILEQYMKRPRG